ncbi:hypothetical protein BJ138DRAFT_1094126 [Hygrophoropsis aurantiaca]|uniref:Uncharacterized protein n=1 Tax=Hygrophoropsis aurantiaca TaxID=72124 RepID=A0ACB8A070_9AGAM|nr:hypothetical protein BJ138DRAFT_1094126 [Hygrophoropsis aurantiaca]
MQLNSELPRQKRHIRNVQLFYSDLVPLIEKGHKLPSATIDAYGIVLRDVNLKENNCAIFSSWFAPLATEKTPSRMAEGTIEEHILVAELLHMPVPRIRDQDHPIVLVPLGAPMRKSKPKKQHQTPVAQSDDDSTSEGSDDDEEININSRGATKGSVSELATSAALDAARMSALSQDFDEFAAESTPPNPPYCATPIVSGPSIPEVASMHTSIVVQSRLLDVNCRLSVSQMLKARKYLQSETATKSERVVQISPKFALHRVLAAGDQKIKPSEASHRVRVAQALGPVQANPKKTRELRWQNAAKVPLRAVLSDIVAPNFSTRNVTHFNPLEPGTFVIMRNTAREYIGEVLDIYKKGTSSRYRSVPAAPSVTDLRSSLSLRVYLPMKANNSQISFSFDFDDNTHTTTPPFTSCEHKFDIHTHAPIEHLVFNLGKKALNGDKTGPCTLSVEAAICWNSLTTSKVLQQLPKLKIPGGRMQGNKE